LLSAAVADHDHIEGQINRSVSIVTKNTHQMSQNPIPSNMDQQFVITDEYIELNKLLKASGVCDTGGQAKMIIEDGLVFVDGEIETRKRRKIKDGMIVKYGAHRVNVVCKKQ
jgi:ribosome-associated protein